MKVNTLKKTDIRISRIGIGTNKVGGHNYYRNLDETEGKDFVKEAIRLGVNFIDTADVYGLGRSEELIGEVLQNIDTKREDLIIATKGGITDSQGTGKESNNKPEYLRSALEESLKRLQTDYVDLYYLHFPDGQTPISEAVGELSRLKDEGKIRAIGVSNLSLEQLKEADQTAEISALQSSYSMLDRAVEKDVLPYCAQHDISFIPYLPLFNGLLTGKYSVENADQTILGADKLHENLEKVEKLQVIVKDKQTTMPNLALAWLLAQDGVDAVIPGGRRPDQVRGVVGASDVNLTATDLEKINEILL